MPPANKIRLVIIEDNRLLREGVVSLLKEQRDFGLVAAAGRVHDGILKALELKPDVVLVNSSPQGADISSALGTFRRKLPRTNVIIMDLIENEDILDFVQAGASGFVLKGATFKELVLTIKTVAQGAKVLPASLTGCLFAQIVDHATSLSPAEVFNGVRMTTREREIFQLIAQGLTNKEVADRLDITLYTVKNHVHSILEKLALRSRLQIVASGRRRGATPAAPKAQRASG